MKLNFGHGTLTFLSCFSHGSIGILYKHERFKLSIHLTHMQSSMYVRVLQPHQRQIFDLIYVSARLVLPSDQYILKEKKIKTLLNFLPIHTSYFRQ